MNPARILLRAAAVAMLFAAPGYAASAESPAPLFERDVLPLLREYCYDCHDEGTRKSGLNLEQFGDLAATLGHRTIWAGVLEKVESRQMPPPLDEFQPTDEERRRMINWIVHLAEQPDPQLAARDPGKPVLRRLTRLEYNNTVRDLLGLPTDVFMFPERLPFAHKAYFDPSRPALGDVVEVALREQGNKYPVLLPSSGLPGDNRAEHGYRNRGDANNLSPLMLEQYVALAGEIASHSDLVRRSPAFAALAGIDPATLPPPAAPVVAAVPRREAVPVSAAPDYAPKVTDLPAAPGSAASLVAFRQSLARAVSGGLGGVFAVPLDNTNRTVAGGIGSIRVPLTGRTIVLTPDRDLWLVGFSTAQATSDNLLIANKAKGEKTYDLAFRVESEDAEEGVQALGLCVVGRRGQSGAVTLTARFSDATESRLTAMIAEGAGGTTFFAFAAPPGERLLALSIDGSAFTGDYVLIDDLGFVTNGTPQPVPPPALTAQIEPRPVEAEVVAPPPSPAPRVGPAPPARERVAAFLERAFRRPVADDELALYLGLWDSVLRSGKDEVAAARLVVQTVLASPRLLYLSERVDPVAGTVRPLDDHELAARLAYFLWASTPDEPLLAEARAGRLRDPAVLEAQTRRMLRDPRSRELSESFATQWLRLDQLSTAKPDPDLFKAFYSGPQGKDTLHGAMLVEALLLFETVMVEDRSILDFIGAEYTWLNPRLARFYGITSSAMPAAPSPVPGASNREIREAANKVANTWVRVPLTDRTRGGFIAMAGPLTVTSLPFRTSPVKRGAWLLETIFNRPPQEPKVAFAIENDTKEEAAARSIREKFEAHRNQAACYSCHVRLDPPGFALERFDPVGRWRETDGGQPVDARGEWNGVSFDGPAGYKEALLRDPGEFTRGFVEHLLGYALGRKLQLYDLPAVAEIEKAAAGDGHRFSQIVVGIVQSYPFRHTRNHDGVKQTTTP